MSQADLAAGIRASAFLRQAEHHGGFGTVLHKGDAERGSLLLMIFERGTYCSFLERRLGFDGRYGWAIAGPAASDPDDLAQYLERVTRSDPDCWILELDIPSAERFIAETIAEG